MILVTGGTGYLGSHVAACLLEAGHRVVILDNLSNSDACVLDRLENITRVRPSFVQGDIRDGDLLKQLFAQHKISAVMHFAGLKSVRESVEQPLNYYDQNVGGTVSLLNEMKAAGVKTIIFSSSAMVYSPQAPMPLREDSPLDPANPYGQSKLMIEKILADLHRADSDWKMAVLRYFNPVGAHKSGLIGEAPQGVPNNLMPYISQVVIGRRDQLTVYGNDYPTPDGTGVRDYIHVLDLAEGHLAALRYLQQKGDYLTLNLGTGRGESVLAVVRAFEKACGKPIPLRIAGRRAGDVPTLCADVTLAARLMGWRAQHDLDAMCADTWAWQQMNPKGWGR